MSNIMFEIRKTSLIDTGIALNKNILDTLSPSDRRVLLSELVDSEEGFIEELVSKLHHPELRLLCKYLPYFIEDSVYYHGTYQRGMPFCDSLQNNREFLFEINRERKTELASVLISLGIPRGWLRHCFFRR